MIDDQLSTEREQEARRRMATLPCPVTMMSAVAKVAPDRDAYVYYRTAHDQDPRRVSFAEAADVATKIAATLVACGIGPDDGVAILGPSIPETMFALAAAASVAVAVPLNPLLNVNALASQLQLGRVKAIIVFGKHVAVAHDQLAADAAAMAGGVSVIIEIDAEHGRSAALAELPARNLTWQECLAISADDFRPRDGERAAALFHTGGTTGSPKLAELSLESLMASLHCSALGLGWRENDRVLQLMPFFHVGGGLIAGLGLYSTGATLINASLSGARDRDVIENLWALGARAKANILCLVPPSWSLVAATPKPQRWPELRMLLTGAAPMTRELALQLGRIAGVPMAQALGMTELSGSGSNQPLDGIDREPSVGYPTPLVETRLRPIAEDGPVELMVRGPMLFRGYRTPSGLASPIENGWYPTGDLAEILDDGQMRLVGRTKDVIIRSGHNIDPAMIEDAAARHPDIVISAAVGMPDDFAGELPVLYAVRATGAATSEHDVLAFLAQHVDEPPARPRRVMFIDALPLTPVGKIARYKLRQSAAVTRASEILSPLGDVVQGVTCNDVAARKLIIDWGSAANRAAQQRVAAALAPFGLSI